MAITALPGYIIDPNNPNGVIRDPNVATTLGGYTPSTQPTSTAFGAVNTQPIVTPNPSGNLQNTLTTPQAPTTPSIPAPTQPTTPTSTTAAPGTGLDSNSFANLLGSLNTGLQQNNAIVDQKNAVVNAMLGNTIDPATLAKLPPDIQSVIQSGDRSALMIQANILNNALQGKNDATANAIKYLSSDYQTTVQQAETDKQNAINTLLKIAQNFANPTTGTIDTTKLQSALSNLYPGVDLSGVISQLHGTPTVTTSSGDAAYTTDNDPTTVDPDSQSILAQTGLSVLAFNYLTQGTTALSRLSASDRQAVFKEAEDFLNKSGIDYSTFQSQYKAQNAVLQSNVERAANTKVFAGEVSGTAQQFINDVGSDFSNLKPATVAQLFATGQTNDKTAQKYAFDLQTMQNDLAGYYAASRGANSPDQSDLAAAAKVITQGLSGQGAQAFKDSIDANEKKVSTVVNNAVTDAQKAIWTQFGVGGKYKSPTDTSSTSTLPSDVQTKIAQNISFSPDGKTAYLPRSVWSTLGPNMDAVLTEAKNDGYTLLIQ